MTPLVDESGVAVPELERFLRDVHFILPNFNDTFGYASADTEQISVGDGYGMASMWRRFGWYGLVAIAADKRKQNPLPAIGSHPNFIAALDALDEPCPDPEDPDESWTIRDEVCE